MKPQGGTELLYNNLIKYAGADWQKNVNLILSFCDDRLLSPDKTNIIWQHLATDQAAIAGMRYPEFIDSVDEFVYVSDWQLRQYQEVFGISSANNIVIKNAIEPIEFKEKPTDRIRLLYTSMPNRGLDVLLDAFEMIDTDAELIIYSSNIIYGKGYFAQVGSMHDRLFQRAKTMKNVTYKGFVTNKAVRAALQQAHILAYPSTYEETSCIAAIEAGAAGCQIVTTDLGALSETCGSYATYVSPDRQTLVYDYACELADAINNYNPNDPVLKEQSDWFNSYYSWDKRKLEWMKLLYDENQQALNRTQN